MPHRRTGGLGPVCLWLTRAILSYSTRRRDEIPVISVAAVAYGVDCFEPLGISGQGLPARAMATMWLVRCACTSLREPWRRDRCPCDETDMQWPSLKGPLMHVRAHSRKSCCTGRIGGLMVSGIMVGSTEGPVSLRAAACGRWLKTAVFGGEHPRHSSGRHLRRP